MKFILFVKRGWQILFITRKMHAGKPAKLDRSIPKLTIPEIRNLAKPQL